MKESDIFVGQRVQGGNIVGTITHHVDGEKDPLNVRIHWDSDTDEWLYPAEVTAVTRLKEYIDFKIVTKLVHDAYEEGYSDGYE